MQVFGKPGLETYDALLYDPMPGGSGLLEQMIDHWPAVIQRTLNLVEDCPSACETSCVDCLQHFRNSFYHSELNRHTAQTFLREWGNSVRFSHESPAVLPDETQTQAPGNPPEQQLIAMLKAAWLVKLRQRNPSFCLVESPCCTTAGVVQARGRLSKEGKAEEPPFLFVHCGQVWP